MELKQDMYWFFTNRDSYKINFEVENPLLGSLADDWEALKKITEDEQITTYADFERLSAILKAVCEELSPEE